jgi:hypothetical protein
MIDGVAMNVPLLSQVFRDAGTSCGRINQRFYMDASLLQGIFQRCSDKESRSSISGLVRGIAAGPDEIR